MPTEPRLNQPDPIESEMDAQETIESAMHGIEEKLHHAQDLLFRLQENLMGQQQRELENILAEGVELLSQQVKMLKGETKGIVSEAKTSVQVNPYAGIVAALRVGLALSQVLAARKAGASSQMRYEAPDRPLPEDEASFTRDPAAHGQEFVSDPENYGTRH